MGHMWPMGRGLGMPGLEHRTPDGKTWVRCPYHQIPFEYTRSTCSLNQWVRMSCGLNHECRELEKISLHFSSMPKLGWWS
ncbi:hypothetical protein TNCV_2155021 [Trichonephila clavipes]|nr:hypothetical protein TNCV_2155021 [Trichonephila clavipes]